MGCGLAGWGRGRSWPRPGGQAQGVLAPHDSPPGAAPPHFSLGPGDSGPPRPEPLEFPGRPRLDRSRGPSPPSNSPVCTPSPHTARVPVPDPAPDRRPRRALRLSGRRGPGRQDRGHLRRRLPGPPRPSGEPRRGLQPWHRDGAVALLPARPESPSGPLGPNLVRSGPRGQSGVSPECLGVCPQIQKRNEWRESAKHPCKNIALDSRFGPWKTKHMG